MQNLNIDTYLNKVDGDVLNASDWNESLSQIQTKVNQLVTSENNDHEDSSIDLNRLKTITIDITNINGMPFDSYAASDITYTINNSTTLMSYISGADSFINLAQYHLNTGTRFLFVLDGETINGTSAKSTYNALCTDPITVGGPSGTKGVNIVGIVKGKIVTLSVAYLGYTGYGFVSAKFVINNIFPSNSYYTKDETDSLITSTDAYTLVDSLPTASADKMGKLYISSSDNSIYFVEEKSWAISYDNVDGMLTNMSIDKLESDPSLVGEGVFIFNDILENRAYYCVIQRAATELGYSITIIRTAEKVIARLKNSNVYIVNDNKIWTNFYGLEDHYYEWNSITTGYTKTETESKFKGEGTNAYIYPFRFVGKFHTDSNSTSTEQFNSFLDELATTTDLTNTGHLRCTVEGHNIDIINYVINWKEQKAVQVVYGPVKKNSANGQININYTGKFTFLSRYVENNLQTATDWKDITDVDFSNYYTKEEVDDLLANKANSSIVSSLDIFDIVSVNVLPNVNTASSRKIYIVPNDNPQSNNVKDKYIAISREYFIYNNNKFYLNYKGETYGFWENTEEPIYGEGNVYLHSGTHPLNNNGECKDDAIELGEDDGTNTATIVFGGYGATIGDVYTLISPGQSNEEGTDYVFTNEGKWEILDNYRTQFYNGHTGSYRRERTWEKI